MGACVLNIFMAEDERFLVWFLRRMGDFDVLWDFEDIKNVWFSIDESLDSFECLDYLEMRFGSLAVTQETSGESVARSLLSLFGR